MSAAPSRPDATRRAVLAAAGAAGAAATLAACGGTGGGGGTDDSAGGGGGPLGKAADVPEGGGTVFRERKVVVTRPKGGGYKAFSAVCTHAGCLVDAVADGTINCPCHGSRYDIEDGHVVGGPAPRALPARKVTVKGGVLELE